MELPKFVDRKYLIPGFVVVLGMAMLGLGQESGWALVAGGLLLGGLQ